MLLVINNLLDSTPFHSEIRYSQVLPLPCLLKSLYAITRSEKMIINDPHLTINIISYTDIFLSWINNEN